MSMARTHAAPAMSDHACPDPASLQGLITRPALVAEFLTGCSLDSAIRRKADFLQADLVLAKVALDAARVGEMRICGVTLWVDGWS